jgi:hypothetical protein
MTRDDISGGPAFPTEVVTTNDGWLHGGMTLRDYFAAKAMQAILARPDCTVTDIEAVARGAYEVAKVMLETRENMK